jgi:preprotein translocase subunit SecE
VGCQWNSAWRLVAVMAANTKSKKNSVAKVKEPSPFSPKQIKQFVQEVKAEFLKIVWPDKKMTLGLTGVVVLLTVVISIYLGSVDLVLGKLISTFLR